MVGWNMEQKNVMMEEKKLAAPVFFLAPIEDPQQKMLWSCWRSNFRFEEELLFPQRHQELETAFRNTREMIQPI